jgi:tRNA A-37 threonylcarbamoyl transferase component Bud32
MFDDNAYTSSDLYNIRAVISTLPFMSESEAHEMNKLLDEGHCPIHIAPLYKISKSNSDLYKKLLLDPFLVKYSVYGFFPGAYELTYLNDMRAEIRYEGRSRGRVAIITNQDSSLVIKPIQNSKEAHVADIASKLEIGAKQHPTLTGFLAEEFVEGCFLTDLDRQSLTNDYMEYIGSQLGFMLAQLHDKGIYYNDSTVSDPNGRSHLIINNSGKAKLIDFGISISLDQYPELSLEETHNYVRTLPLYRLFSSMNPDPKDITEFIRQYQRKFFKTPTKDILARDIRFMKEGLSFLVADLDLGRESAFNRGFDSKYFYK